MGIEGKYIHVQQTFQQTVGVLLCYHIIYAYVYNIVIMY